MYDAATLCLVVRTAGHGSGGTHRRRHRQRSFGVGLIAEEIEDLQETWMRHVELNVTRRYSQAACRMIAGENR